jgi:hypothetical protein
MRSILKICVLVLPLSAVAASAQGGRLESSAIPAMTGGVDAAPGVASRIDVPSANRTGEVLVNLPSDLSPDVIDSLARRHRLTRLESQAIGLLGRTVHRWRIADGRSMPDVIRALKLDGGIDAQPNNVYTLQ